MEEPIEEEGKNEVSSSLLDASQRETEMVTNRNASSFTTQEGSRTACAFASLLFDALRRKK